MRLSIKLFIFFCTVTTVMQAQTTQTLRGTIVDKESNFPLIGVNVSLDSPDGTQHGTTTELDGTFRFDEVSLGRHSFQCSYIGYEPVILSEEANQHGWRPTSQEYRAEMTHVMML